MPLSGSEETFTNAKYGSPRGIRNNNCYAWAIGHYANGGGIKLQPGDLSGYTDRMSLKSCKDLKERVLKDSKSPGQKPLYLVKPAARCHRGYYKVMAFLDPSTDYHWYRQHRDVLYKVQDGNSLTAISRKMGVSPDKVAAHKPLAPGQRVLVRNAGLWSHKQGFAGGPKLDDACGRTIKDPRRACRDYGEYNYERFCGAYCVRADPGPGRNRRNRATAKRPRRGREAAL